MALEKIQAIVLAAGKSTRFKTGKTKLVEKICGQKMLLYQTKLLAQMNVPTTLVVGYQKEIIQEAVQHAHNDTVQFVVQEEQKGTGHALWCTKPTWNKEHILIMNGDMPLISESIIQELYDKHKTNNADISFVSAHLVDPNHSYGRVIKKESGIEIIEAKDFTLDPHEHCCINAGIYLAKRSFLEESCAKIKANEKCNEFYITDLIKIASNNNNTVVTTTAPFDLVRGINTLQELWAAEQIKRSEIIKEWMEKGVRFSVAQNVHIDLDVTIGAGSSIGSGVHLLAGTKIGNNSAIHESSSLSNMTVGDNVVIHPFCVLSDSSIGSNASIGPFAHVRNSATIGNNAVIGNFVEVKESVIGDYSKAKHLAYIGNAHLGSRVNVGAGTIFCNHNGVSKNKTVVGDAAYIGSNNTLVAPLTIGKQAFTAAGSVITHDVSAGSLAIGRSRQINKEGYVDKFMVSPITEGVLEQADEQLFFAGAIKTNNNTNTPDNL